MFAYVGDSEFGKDTLQFITGAKIVHEIYMRFTAEDTIMEALRVCLLV